MTDVSKLSQFPAHLGLDATCTREPEFTGAMEWYMQYAERHAADGAEGRLVSMHTFREPWGAWEMHPEGAELVLCTAGTLVIVQEIDGATRSLTLRPGEYAINPPGVWHTADVEDEATAVFITAGKGTQGRPR